MGVVVHVAKLSWAVIMEVGECMECMVSVKVMLIAGIGPAAVSNRLEEKILSESRFHTHCSTARLRIIMV